MVGAGLSAADAQATKKDKQAAKIAAIKKSIDTSCYTFVADYALPLRGGSRPVDPEYDLRVTKDSVTAYLPYFGEAHFDVPYGASDGGIKFTSTKFDYKVKNNNKGGWEITIKPTDVKNMGMLILHISANGYASLSVNSANRDAITFNGHLNE